MENYVDLTNFNKLKFQIESPEFNEQFDCIKKISNLVDEFNKNINNQNKLLIIVKQMRQLHGIIIKKFFDTLKSQGNFNHEEFYILSMTDSCYVTTREIIRQAENILQGTNHGLLDNVTLNNN